MVKRLLIIDDSEIDREVLKNILSSDFDIVEADNGYSGMEIILGKSTKIDAVLLDISMPVLDGFNVLQLMQDNGINNLPVVLITAEATENNVHRAISYNIKEFILKPFDPQTILSRLCTLLDVEEDSQPVTTSTIHMLNENEINETNNYISKLEWIYKSFLKNIDRSDDHFVRVSSVMNLLLSDYAMQNKALKLTEPAVELISKAAYFYDIGQIAVPERLLPETMQPDKLQRTVIQNETDRHTYESHTSIGANIIWLNHSPSCRYFVQICSDICMHHHERFDGKGYPHRLKGDEISIFTQLCSAAIRFDKIFFKRQERNDIQFEFSIKEISVDSGKFSTEVLDLLKGCRPELLSFYGKRSKRKN